MYSASSDESSTSVVEAEQSDSESHGDGATVVSSESQSESHPESDAISSASKISSMSTSSTSGTTSWGQISQGRTVVGCGLLKYLIGDVEKPDGKCAGK